MTRMRGVNMRHRVTLIDARWTLALDKLDDVSARSSKGARYMNTGDPTPFFVFHFPKQKQVVIVAGKDESIPLTLLWAITTGVACCGMIVERVDDDLVFTGPLTSYRMRLLGLLKLGKNTEVDDDKDLS